MEFERWALQRVDVLKKKAVVGQSKVILPEKLQKQFLKANPNEKNRRGETIMVCVIKYFSEVPVQVSTRKMFPPK